MATKAESLQLEASDVTRWDEIEAIAAKPKGKPSEEEAAALLKQKGLKQAFFDEIRGRFKLDRKDFADKHVLAALELAREKAAKAEKKAGGLATLEPPTGTRDFFPPEMRVREWLFDNFKAVGKAFGFEQYDAPVLEHEELYKRKGGEEITQQMYNFVDKEGFAVTLRPEMTPSLARMFLKNQDAQGNIKDLGPQPWKWFSIPQCWRFESTQRGRKREHYQWNMDIVGLKEITAELELLATVTTFFRNVGIGPEHVGVKINSRKVLQALLTSYGVSGEVFAEVTIIIDKLDKIGPDDVKKGLAEKGVPAASADAILKALTCKTIAELAAFCGPRVDPEAVKELEDLFEMSKGYGFYDYLVFDASVVRGLAYYTGVVFEVFDRRGELRAICGGGRYDGLMTLYGSPTVVPCVGFGFGDCVIMELLKDLNKMPNLDRTIDFAVAAYSLDMFSAAAQTASELRANGFSVNLLQEPKKKVKRAFDYANRIGATFIAFVGPDEWTKGFVRIKYLRGEAAVESKDDGKDDEPEDKGLDVPFKQLNQLDKFFPEHFGQPLAGAPKAAGGLDPRVAALERRAAEAEAALAQLLKRCAALEGSS